MRFFHLPKPLKYAVKKETKKINSQIVPYPRFALMRAEQWGCCDLPTLQQQWIYDRGSVHQFM